MTGTTSSNTTFWYNFLSQSAPAIMKLVRVYPCRCGREHSAVNDDERLYFEHQCFHDKGVIFTGSLFELGFCKLCGMQIPWADAPEGDCYPCPICCYLNSDPCENHNICPCCGTEFGLHDFGSSHEELRIGWLRSGPKWFSAAVPEPKDWNPWLQLAKMWRFKGVKALKSVSEEEMERLFKASGIQGQIERGELREEIIWPPKDESAQEGKP